MIEQKKHVLHMLTKGYIEKKAQTCIKMYLIQ
jgi:hypothetical protein